MFNISDAMDILANTVFEISITSLNAILDLLSDSLKQLADTNPNTKLACIWETHSSYKYGFSSIFQSGLGLEAAGIYFSPISAFSMTRISSGRGDARATSEWQGRDRHLHSRWLNFKNYNLLTEHLFHALADCQSIGDLKVSVSKGRIVATETP